MTEKEKNKGNPFTPVLLPDEEILWLQVRPPERQRSFGVVTAILGIIISVASVGAFALARQSDSRRGVIDALSCVVCISGFFAPRCS
jgi:hypothetical protein